MNRFDWEKFKDLWAISSTPAEWQSDSLIYFWTKYNQTDLKAIQSLW